MKNATDIAADLLRRLPNAPSRTVAKRLFAEHPLRFASLEAARSTVRRLRGNNGRHRTKSRGLEREPGKAGWTPKCPPSQVEPWSPIDVEKPKRTLILSDVHVPFHDEIALQTAVKFGKRFNPTTVLINGDYADFYSISRFEKDPDKRDLVGEVNNVIDFLAWIRKEFPKADLICKDGNHEARFDKFVINRAAEFWGLDGLQLESLLKFGELKIKRVLDNPIMVGALPVLHGHELNGASTTVNPARGVFNKTKHTCLIGHHHRSSSHAESNLFSQETATWSTGCLCELTPAYARVNAWNLGFAAIEVEKSDHFNVNNMRIVDGEIRSS